MKRFKEIDCWISTGLIISCTIITIVTWSVCNLIQSYFIVGGWQVISMVTHYFKHWFMRKGGSRSFHHWLTLTIGVIALLGWAIQPLLILLLLFLLVFSPILAIGYAAICFGELKELKMRHALNLK